MAESRRLWRRSKSWSRFTEADGGEEGSPEAHELLFAFLNAETQGADIFGDGCAGGVGGHFELAIVRYRHHAIRRAAQTGRGARWWALRCGVLDPFGVYGRVRALEVHTFQHVAQFFETAAPDESDGTGG